MRLLIAAVALMALAACDSPAPADHQVASLKSAAPSVSPESKRPRYRLDMSADDREALMEPYMKCLEKHGYTFLDAKKGGLAEGGEPGTDQKSQELRACELQYYPLVEWERDPANPRAQDFQRAVTKCLKAKGVKMEGDAFTDADVAKGMDLTPECEREAAATLK